MLFRLSILLDAQAEVLDGPVGHVDDLLLDAAPWRLRYLTLRAAALRRHALLPVSPAGIARIDWGHHRLRIALTRLEVDECPALAAPAALSPTDEDQLIKYFGWPNLPRAAARLPFRTTRGDCVNAEGDVVGRLHDFLCDTTRWQLHVAEIIAADETTRHVPVTLLEPGSADDRLTISANAEAIRRSAHLPIEAPWTPEDLRVVQRHYDHASS